MMKKIFLILVLVTFLAFLFDSFCFAQRELEIEYPAVPGVETPITTKTALPEYLRYIFTFAIIIAGLLAFGALIYGGIRYLTSAGDPTKMADARTQVTAGILGLIILLSSYLILNTINPQLILPKKPPIKPAVAGIRIYTMDACQEDDEHPSFKVAQNIKDLTDPDLNWGFNGEKIRSIKFLGGPGDLTASLWSNIEFKGAKTPVGYPAGDTDPCKQSGPDLDFPLVTYKSISLDWHFPGVYLYANDSCAGDDYKIYQLSSATLPEFDNKTQSIKFRYGFRVIQISKDTPVDERNRILARECTNRGGEINLVPIGEKDNNYLYQCITQKYAAILHEKENYMGWCKPFDQEPYPASGWCKSVSGGVSSITVYLKPIGDPIGQGVRFWEDKNYSGEAIPPTPGSYYENGDYDADLSRAPGAANFDNKTTSLEIDGHYVALLFEDEDYGGKCEVFMSSDPDLRNNPLGQCGFLGRFDCLSSFIIKARK